MNRDVGQVTQAFSPLQTGTVSVTAGAASSNVALTLPPAKNGLPPQIDQLHVFNSGTVPVFINWGLTSGVVAVAPAGATPGDYPVGPGATLIISVDGNPKFVAAIGTAAVPVVYITPGTGM